MASVYFVQNIQNHKIYVGVTTGLIQDRWKKHVNKAKNGSRLKFHCAIRKYGPESFFWVEAGSFDILADAYEREAILIRMLDSRNTGYNIAHGGSDGVRKEITINGVAYPSCAAAAKAYNVDYKTMMNRLTKSGMSPENSVSLDRFTNSKRGSVQVKGVIYTTLTAAAREFGVDKLNVHKRVRNLGWSIEQALGIDPPPVRSWKRKKN